MSQAEDDPSGSEPIDHEGDGDLHDADGVDALYDGDLGTLPEDARRVLVQLLSGPALEGHRHPRQWPALLRHQQVLRSRLADLFLELVLDADARVAFVRQADTGELDTPILLRRTRLTFLESVLLLQLRQHLAQADVRGEPAVVSRDEMTEQMRLYEKQVSTDPAGFERRINSAIEKVKKNNLISAIRGSQERYELSPTLKLLFSAEQVADLAKRFAALLAADDGAGEADAAEVRASREDEDEDDDASF